MRRGTAAFVHIFPGHIAGNARAAGYTRTVIHFVRIRHAAEHGQQRAGAAWRVMQSQPHWVYRWVGTLFLLILALPILVIALLALFGAVVLFIILVIVNAILRAFRAVLPRRDGRKNVKVIVRR